MPLSSGVRLGPYEIVSAVGAGGMGDVYKARDTRLDRTVAIKVIANTIAATAEARQRFEREARSLSALNHPHICTLHDIGRHQDIEFLVPDARRGPNSPISPRSAFRPGRRDQRAAFRRDERLDTPIDLVDLDRASGLLRYRVARDGQVIFEEESRLNERFKLAARGVFTRPASAPRPSLLAVPPGG